MDIKQFSIGGQYGIDDLEGQLGDMEVEFWDEQKWTAYRSGAEDRQRRNKIYVDSLKANGKYGKKYETKIHFVAMPLFNDSGSATKESYSFRVLNFK